ncbi:hypothetical protein CsSME_00026211 [Camellia sinensis var. sinensis]
MRAKWRKQEHDVFSTWSNVLESYKTKLLCAALHFHAQFKNYYLSAFSSYAKKSVPRKLKDPNESLPKEREFKVPNFEKVIEEGKKIPSKFRKIKLHKLGDEIQTDMYTATGWPSITVDALKTLAGKASAEFDSADEADQLESDDSIENLPGAEASEMKGRASDGRESAYGTAYAAFGEGQEGKEACHAIAALCEVCSIDSLISNFILPLQLWRGFAFGVGMDVGTGVKT